MSAQSPELQSRIAIWRAKAIDGSLTLEDMKEAVRAMRAGRISAAYSSEAARRSKAKSTVKDGDELLKELEGL